ncbi:MAG: hypothetical protein IJH45_06985 [Firmicutes bacterium]|jgi:hypothetical protein|nr:hypothetical protein [Bacillota bacterium]MBQ6606778.1 hypothetical protein [Bacillota bacterium]MBR0178937.1 hypothetical protein [Bacillota bacterium]MBR0375842.1 hypothetical protein [Bacillota bacterium]
MKKTMIMILLLSLVLLFAACGADLNTLAISNIQRSEDSITADLTFDGSYENVSVAFHSDVDNDAFTGTADYTCELGAVEAGQAYPVEATTGGGWTYSGEFRMVSISNGQFNIEPPDLAGETIVITVLDGDTELISAESKP